MPPLSGKAMTVIVVHLRPSEESFSNLVLGDLLAAEPTQEPLQLSERSDQFGSGSEVALATLLLVLLARAENVPEPACEER
jgi:hypothetical protein